MRKLLLLFICSIYFSCQEKDTEIFFAVQKNETGDLELKITKDYKYKIIKDDSILDKGDAVVNKSEIELVPTPESPLITLIHNKKFILKNDSLCGIEYKRPYQKMNDSILEQAEEVANLKNCFIVKKNLLKRIN
ncbi:hypothetical protein [Christiangramia sp. SM2212]|uniref:Lipoprotein n=1 Tax=Christiangramia sediminicola TaxID=3073267 RepID=A0ABU1ETF3_9FLAO|nr:hypothetical protein [Christiangramia sp. SM2212]MDR5591671.1 hypothetical protein [Christiangramia sp. SM2212]